MLKEIAEIIEQDFESQLQDGFTYSLEISKYIDNGVWWFTVEILGICQSDGYYDFDYPSDNKLVMESYENQDKETFLKNLKTNCIELVKQLEDELEANTPQSVKDANEQEYRQEQQADDFRQGL